jgi:enoyl-CoA hydratase/carnithine racemase
MPDRPIRHHEVHGIHRVILDDGANPLNLPLMAAIRDVVAGLREHGAPPLLLASSHPTVFCPGWDLKRLAGADRGRVRANLEVFNGLILDVFSYPGPTAAAITGHAVGGGWLLALACDLRVMAVGRPRLGFAELNLGVPVPAGSVHMLRARCTPFAIAEALLRGEGCTAERAHELGLVHWVEPVEQVVVAVDRELSRLASRPARAYVTTKEMLFGETWRAMRVSSAAEDERFLDCWFSAEAQQRIAELATSLGG